MVFARVAAARAPAPGRARVPAIAAVVALLLAALPLGLQSQTASPEPVRTQAEGSTEQVVAGLSQDAVSITTDFTGSEILIYGAVKRETAPPDGGPLGVIVTMQGPSQAVKVRKKERRFGIWMNTSSLVIGAAPDFYAVATSAPLGEMLLPAEDVQHRISIPLAVRALGQPVGVSDATDFTSAFLRLREANGRYRLDEGSVRLIEDTLFRADIALPAALVEGQYKASIFLTRNGHVISEYSAPVGVAKVGLERWLYRLAMERPFWYGLMSLGFAVGAGWAASAAFRLVQRK